ncbi:hypothetical protein M885DRAFT_125546 [Pelagophyceae sp. CCMP2097]|nr:hypothetical protein M885DRAFT_125546 [Pelagophyceae sp. CCMP2097]
MNARERRGQRARKRAIPLECRQMPALGKYPEAQTDLQTALGGAAALPQAERASLERDAKRIAKLQSHATLSAAAKVERLGEERAVSKARVSGVPLEEKQQGPRSGPGASLGYIEEQDHSHWALQRLASLLEEVDVDLGGGASVAVDSALLRQCVVSASVTRKRGQRALYYEFDVHARWTAESPPDYDVSGSAAGADAPRPLKGVVRLYNVSHETKYEPGADTNVAYMYQLGYQGLPTAQEARVPMPRECSTMPLRSSDVPRNFSSLTLVRLFQVVRRRSRDGIGAGLGREAHQRRARALRRRLRQGRRARERAARKVKRTNFL